MCSVTTVFLGRKLTDSYYDRRADFDRVATDIGLSLYAADDDEDDDVRESG